MNKHLILTLLSFLCIINIAIGEKFTESEENEILEIQSNDSEYIKDIKLHAKNDPNKTPYVRKIADTFFYGLKGTELDHKKALSIYEKVLDGNEFNNFLKDVWDGYEYNERFGKFSEIKWNINKIDKYGMTPIHFAVSNGHTFMANFLINHGANTNLLDKNYNSPISIAFENNDLKMMELLINNGANINDKDLKTGEYFLHKALNNESLDMFYFLIKNDADPNVKNFNECTPLHIAAKKNLIQPTEKLITLKIDINAKNREGMTPIQTAAKHGNINIVEILYHNGATIDDRSYFGQNCLHFAVIGQHLGIIKLFLDNGLDPNYQDKALQTPLHLALKKHDKFSMNPSIKLLLSYGADPNIKDNESKTPLFYAVENNLLLTVKLLVKNGANPNIGARSIKTLFDIAKDESMIEALNTKSDPSKLEILKMRKLTKNPKIISPKLQKNNIFSLNKASTLRHTKSDGLGKRLALPPLITP